MAKLRDIKRQRYIGLVVDATDPKNVKLIRDELNLNDDYDSIIDYLVAEMERNNQNIEDIESWKSELIKKDSVEILGYIYQIHELDFFAKDSTQINFASLGELVADLVNRGYDVKRKENELIFQKQYFFVFVTINGSLIEVKEAGNE